MSQNAPNGGNAVNLKTGKKPPKHRSNFDLSYRLACTPRYGFATPFFKFEGIPGDRVTLRSGHNLRTMSLKSPLFQNLRMNKDFYAVPMKALLPLNWDKLYNNPVQGDDIDPTRINTLIGSYSSVERYGRFMYNILYNMKLMVSRVGVSNDYAEFRYIAYLTMLMDTFAGKGNLFESFRIDPWFGINRMLTVKTKDASKILFEAWHAYLDKLQSYLATQHDLKFSVDFTDDNLVALYTKTYDLASMKDRMRLYYDICDNPLFTPADYKFNGGIYSACNTAWVNALKPLVPLNPETTNGLTDYITELINLMQATASNGGARDQFVNVAPILGYQMIMAEYFSNDHVDLVYNSDMFRQVIMTYGLCKDFAGNDISSNSASFEWNGKHYMYDAFSAVSLNNIASYDIQSGTTGNIMVYVAVLQSLFGIQRGLKYIDYFTGSRTRPIATGDLNITVNNEKVDVIDVTQKIQWQRFLNQVNRIGPDAKNYLKGLFDVEERQHIDVPVKIGHIDETVYGEEVQNTADAQQSEPNSITTNLKSRGSNYAFEFNISESTIVIGLVTFSIRRFYNNGNDPFSRKIDRFDMFNPYLQFTGDQPIYLQELARDSDHDDIFGYTGRYAEYKNAVDYAVGDFQDALESWIFSDTTAAAQSGDNMKHVHVSPEFIRQVPTELDDYYLNMTGKTPGDRYHFIIVFDNQVQASRDMVFNPQILG